MLLNDIYTVRLTVFDKGGNATSASVNYQAARDAKVGIFTLAFQDLSIPLAGLPITVNRVYDSRDKGRGDFGIGWRLDVQTMKIRANRSRGRVGRSTAPEASSPPTPSSAATSTKSALRYPTGEWKNSTSPLPPAASKWSRCSS